MSRHRTVSELAALDELTGRKRAAVRAHLADCVACRRELSFTREVRHLAGQVTSPVAPPASLDRILGRRSAGERVILPAAVPTDLPGRRPMLRLAVGATLAVTVAIAAQMAVRTARYVPAEPASGDMVQSAEPPTVGIAIVPSRFPADVRIVGAPAIRVEVLLHDGPELGVRGQGTAAGARFQTAGGGIVVTGVTGGAVELRIPRGARTRLFVNDRLELTSDGQSLRIERSGVVRERVTLDLGS